MATQSFSAQIAAWCQKVPEAAEAVFKGAAQEITEQMDGILTQSVYGTEDAVLPERGGYKRTGFLRASLMASTSAMPVLNRENPGKPVPFDFGPIEAVIAGADLGETVFIGYTAEYAGHVHYGANGQAPRPWVTMAAQRWQSIIDAETKKQKSAYGL